MEQGISLMTYLISGPQQIRIFLYAVGFGFFIGILYDLFRTLRLLLTNGKRAFLVSDILFSLAAGLFTFLFALVQLDGTIRGYALFGEIIGFLIYSVTFGVFFTKLSDRIVRGISRIFRTLARPFLYLYRKACKFFRKNVEKTRKKAKFSVKKSKFHLKSTKGLLYNLRVRVSSDRRKNSRNESDGNTNESETAQKTKT